MPKLYLGEILVKNKAITPEQLQIALYEQKASGEFLGAILLRKRLITEKDLLQGLAEQFEVPFMSIKGVYIDWGLVGIFNSSLILDHRCFPLSCDDDYVTFAINNPLDIWLLGEAEREASPRKIKTVLVSAADMEELIQRYREYMQNKLKDVFE